MNQSKEEWKRHLAGTSPNVSIDEFYRWEERMKNELYDNSAACTTRFGSGSVTISRDDYRLKLLCGLLGTSK